MIRNIARVGGQAMAVGAAFRDLRQARADGDTLRIVEAIINALAIATTIAILIREIRGRRDRKLLHLDRT